MAIVGTIVVALGAFALLLSGVLLFGVWQEQTRGPEGSWFANEFAVVASIASFVFALIGLGGILMGRWLILKDRQEFCTLGGIGNLPLEGQSEVGNQRDDGEWPPPR